MPQLSIDFKQPIPLFPLPNCVLLPHATIPLHIFEPRYRQMTNDALDSRGLIAMASFAGESWKQSYADAPPVREHVCVGYVIRHERLPDGRYNILLQGVCRARIREEVESSPYRMVMLDPTEQTVNDYGDLEEHRECIESLLEDPLLKTLASVSGVQNWLSKEIPTGVLVDLSIMCVCDDHEQRYAMLAEADQAARANWLCQHLQQIRRTLAIVERFGSGKTEDGYAVN